MLQDEMLLLGIQVAPRHQVVDKPLVVWVRPINRHAKRAGVALVLQHRSQHRLGLLHLLFPIDVTVLAILTLQLCVARVTVGEHPERCDEHGQRQAARRTARSSDARFESAQGFCTSGAVGARASVRIVIRAAFACMCSDRDGVNSSGSIGARRARRHMSKPGTKRPRDGRARLVR
eukprot:4954942-Prymnesium_polylepis.1